MEIRNILQYMKENQDTYISVFCKFKRKVSFSEFRKDVIKTVLYIEKQLHIQKGEYVGIVGENSYAWLVVDLACLVGGWVLVSFHSKEFADDKIELLKKYNMKLVFADPKYIDDNECFVCLDDLLLGCAEKYDSDVEDYIGDFYFRPEDIFTIIYTSGTTGIPKALKINLQGVESFINGFYNLYDFRSDDRVFIFLPLSVLTCRAYVYASLMGGSNIILADMSSFIIAMKLGKPTVMQGVPHLFETVYETVNTVIENDKKKKFLLNTFWKLKSKKLLPKTTIEKIQNKYLKNFYDFWGGEMRFMITGSASIRTNVLHFYNNAGISLYEAYGINEGGVLAINTPHNVKVGSVGRPFMQREIKIAEDGEVLIKRDKYVFSSGYYDEDSDLEHKVFREDGYIATGDIGHFDQEGYLYLSGRKKEIITMNNGEKVMPALLENKIKELNDVKQVCLYGDGKNFLVGIITPTNKDVDKLDLLRKIKKVGNEGDDYTKIKDIVFTEEPFSVENCMLNVNMKLARKEIVAHYEKELKSIFE